MTLIESDTNKWSITPLLGVTLDAHHAHSMLGFLSVLDLHRSFTCCHSSLVDAVTTAVSSYVHLPCCVCENMVSLELPTTSGS